MHTALQALGGLDILVNNAGGVRAGSLQRLSEVEIRRMIEVNLTAPILLTRAALPPEDGAAACIMFRIRNLFAPPAAGRVLFASSAKAG